MKAIILAAGIGTRMGDLTKDKPKCLIELNKKTLLENQIEILGKIGIKNKDVSVVIGNQGKCWTKENQEKIRKIVKNIVVNYENAKTNNSYSLRLGFEKIDKDDVLVIDGDIIFSEDLIKRIIKTDKSVILTKEKEETGNKILMNSDGRVCQLSRNIEKEKLKINLTFAGVFKLNKEDFDIFKKFINKDKYRKLEYGFVLNDSLEKIKIYNTTDNGLFNVNTVKDLENVKKLLDGEIAVIWDLDGVIIDSTPLQLAAYKESFKKFGINIEDIDYLENNGRKNIITFQRICAKYNKNCNFDEWYKDKSKIYFDLIDEKGIKALPGVIELISRLKKRKIKQAVATSASREDLLFILKKLGLKSCFDVLITAEDVTKSKPDPEIFLKAAEKLGVEREKCVVIEDSIHGIISAKEAVMKCIAVSIARRTDNDLSKASMIVKNLEEVDVSKIYNLINFEK